MATASLSAIGYFVPIFAFLLVFIVIYALLAKTQILGGNNGVMLFVSFILASFFVVQASLVELVQFGSAWMSVLIFVLFFVLVILAFIPGIKLGEFLGKGNWFAWVLLAVILIIFVASATYVFNYALNWGMIKDWFSSDWFGMVLLLIIAGVVSWKITAKVKG